MMFAYIGSFIALLLFMPMANAFSGHSTDIAAQQHGWLMAVMVIAAMCVLLFFGCFSWTKERVKPIKEAKSSLKDDIHDLFHNRPWWILFGAGIASLVFNSIRDGAAVYYFKYYIVESDFHVITLFGMSFVLSGLFLSVGQAANIIGVVLAAPVSNKIGKKNTFAIAMLLATALSIIFSSPCSLPPHSASSSIGSTAATWYGYSSSNASSASVPEASFRSCGRCMPTVPTIRNCAAETALQDLSSVPRR